MTMKTNKAYTKRLRITKNGKVVSRGIGQGHFNAKESGTEKQSKHRAKPLSIQMSNKTKSRFLPGANK